MGDDLKVLTAKLVAAYVGDNAVSIGDVPALIASTYAALVNTASPEPSSVERQLPAVSVKKSVAADAIVCLECGKRQKMLKRHLHTAHGLSVEDYRSKWSLPADYPMVAPDYAARRSQLAIDHGLGRKKSDEVEAVSEETKTEAPTSRRGHKYPSSRWSKPPE